MDTLLSYIDLQHLVAIKLIFFVFVALGLFGIWRGWRPSWFIWLIGICSGAAYYLLTNDLALPLWGLKGDEITIAAMYEMFAHGSFFSDFAYSHLPPFYPPLFFWLVALVGKLFNWNGVQMMKFGALATLTLFPILFYTLQARYWHAAIKFKATPGPLAWLFGTVALLFLTDWDAIITKPYEFISGALIILWTVFLLRELHRRRMDAKKWLWFGITGGILFLFFYFWFALSAISIALYNAFARRSIGVAGYGYLILIGALILLVGSPYWWPLTQSYLAQGSENWQLGFFITPWIATAGPKVEFTLKALLGLFGLGTLIWYRRYLYARALLASVAAAYVWQIMGLFTILFFASPLQETKGFAFFMTTALALGAGYGLERLVLWLHKKTDTRRWLGSAAIMGWLLLAVHMLFGTFVDISVVHGTRVVARDVAREEQKLIDFFRFTGRDVFNDVNLQSGVVELHAFLPWNDFIYFNMHNSHPAAGFSERYGVVEELVRATSTAHFYTISQNNGIVPLDRLVFLKLPGDAYPLYFHVDNFPNAAEERTVLIPKNLIAEPYFTAVYDADKYVVFEPRRN